MFQGLNLSWIGSLKENKLTVYKNNQLHIYNTIPFCAHEGREPWYQDVVRLAPFTLMSLDRAKRGSLFSACLNDECKRASLGQERDGRLWTISDG